MAGRHFGFSGNNQLIANGFSDPNNRIAVQGNTATAIAPITAETVGSDMNADFVPETPVM